MRMHFAWVWMAPLLLAAAAAAQTRPVGGLVLSNDQWPRATNLRQWTADVLRISGTEKQSETAQGKAFFEWVRLFSRMAVGGMIQSFEGEHGRERPVLDAHKQLFVYGWGFCDTSSRIAEAAWQSYKGDPKAAERVITQHDDGGYHTMYRLRMDGLYGAFDPRYGYYLIERDAPDARVLDWPEVHGRFEINRGYTHRSRPYFEIHGKEWDRALLIQPAWFETEAAWRAAGAPVENVFGDGKYEMGTRFHEMGFTVKRGMNITRHWDNSARKFYVPAGKHTQREWPFLPSGRFYRVTETSHGGKWPKYDPNYGRAQPYLSAVPTDEGYPADLAGGRTIGQAYGTIEYRPPLESDASGDAIEPGATLVRSAQAPHLRPRALEGGGEAVFDIRSPYVLVDGMLTASARGAELAIRTLQAKPLDASQPDHWTDWQQVCTAAGPCEMELGRPRFNGRDVSIHGVYRFQIRVRVREEIGRTTPAGLSSLALKLYFENGIMSIPPLFAGRNTIRLKAARVPSAPVEVNYVCESAGGEQSYRRVLAPTAFAAGEAAFEVNAPGLKRCRSVSLAY
ncbi:MAG: hypothetical protein KJZ84_10395 [Bryobacteraceae bacterium]|nr:hypothetical protein [Bryobacteraceae bacterium]